MEQNHDSDEVVYRAERPMTETSEPTKESTESTRDTQTARRLLHTAVYYFGFFTFGWVVGQRGAAFLDLLIVTGTDVTLGSVLFTMAGLASIAGALAGGFLLDAFKRPLLMMTGVFVVNALVNSTMALCQQFPLMATLYFVSHFALSVYDVGVHPPLANLWSGRASGMSLQGLHFVFAVGAVISPLATQPFLAPRQEDDHVHPVKELDLNLTGNVSFTNTSLTPSTVQVSSTTIYEDATAYSGINGTGIPDAVMAKETKVFYALLISGALCLLAAMFMVGLCFVPVKSARRAQDAKGRDSEDSTYHNDVEPTTRPKESQGFRKLYVATLVMLGVYNFFASEMEVDFPRYLMTFVVRELQWSKRSGAHITSVYWVGLSVGRLSGVGLVQVLSPVKILLGSLSGMMLAFLGLLVTASLRMDSAVWVFAACVGLCISVLFPTGLVYAHQHVDRLTGRLSALIFTTPMIASMLNPLLLAYLMTNYDDMWYVYTFVIQTALALASFGVLHVLALKLGQARGDAVSREIHVEAHVTEMQVMKKVEGDTKNDGDVTETFLT